MGSIWGCKEWFAWYFYLVSVLACLMSVMAFSASSLEVNLVVTLMSYRFTYIFIDACTV